MPIKSQGTILSVSTAEAAADNISGVSLANPCVVTATAHGIVDGAIIVVEDIGGTIELEDRAFVVDNPATNTVELKGIDSTGFTAWTSGGTIKAQTMTAISENTSIEGFDGQASEIDTTHLRSRAKEFLLGLQDFGNVTLNLFPITDAGQARLRALKAAAAKGTYSIQLSDGSIAAFRAFVKSFSFSNITPDGVVSGQVVLRVTGEPAWFA